MTDTSRRSRTHSWDDPDRLAATAREMSGLEFFDAWRRRELIPPISATLDFELIEFEPGKVVIGCQPEEFHYSPYGMLHGGLAATLLDTATGCAIHTELPAGTGYATVNLSVTYLRPITVDSGSLRSIGEAITVGRRAAFAEGVIVDAEDRRLAQATASCVVLGPTS